jgi:predicted TIM-barrel fold metal-dependent hydrolase
MSPSLKPPGFENVPIIDAHTHIFPPRLFDRIWEYFEQHYWHVNYKMYADRIARFYRDAGFGGFTTLCYAHKPNIAKGMNEFIADFAHKTPEAIPFGTVHPGDENLLKDAEYALGSLNLQGFKFQLMVTDFFIDDPRLMPVYELVRKMDKILVVHAGNGPLSTPYVGVQHFKRLMQRFPDLRIQVAHFGCFEYGEFFGLLQQYPHMYMDSAMILVDHTLFPSRFDLDISILSRYEDRIMFGSDFPNIPYAFEVSWKFFLTLGLDKNLLEKFFYRNALLLYHR